jgi:hypothetical protein
LDEVPNPTPILRDPALIMADPHEQDGLFTNKIARTIVKDLNKLAKERINDTVSTLRTEMSEGRLRAAAPLHAEAEHAGRSDTVTAPLHYLYLLNGVDAEVANYQFSRDSKYTVAQYLYIMHGERVRKNALLEPIDDNDEIDIVYDPKINKSISLTKSAADNGIFAAFSDALSEYKQMYPGRPLPRISSIVVFAWLAIKILAAS